MGRVRQGRAPERWGPMLWEDVNVKGDNRLKNIGIYSPLGFCSVASTGISRTCNECGSAEERLIAGWRREIAHFCHSKHSTGS